MPSNGVTLYTIGYEGRTLTSLIRELQAHGIERLIDVRLTPRSRKKGMSLMSLFENLRKGGIHYDHIGRLGNPPEIRAAFHAGMIDEGRRLYRGILTNGRAKDVDALIGLARAQRTAILCREADAEGCHRRVIADVAVERAPGLKITHL